MKSKNGLQGKSLPKRSGGCFDALQLKTELHARKDTVKLR